LLYFVSIKGQSTNTKTLGQIFADHALKHMFTLKAHRGSCKQTNTLIQTLICVWAYLLSVKNPKKCRFKY